MFTSEPSLTQRIERMIGAVRVVDTRSDLDVRAPGAPDLAALIGALPVRIVLAGVGMSPALLDPARSAEERVAAALPYLRRVRSTAAGWCLFRILRDLYDFDEPHLTAANCGALLDRVRRSAADPAWATAVLRDRAKVGMVVAPAPTEPTDGPDLDCIAHRLEVAQTEPGDETAESIRRQVFDQLDRQLEGRIRFVSCRGPIRLDNPVHAAVLQWHHLHCWPIQVLLDSPLTAAGLPAIIEAVQTYPAARFGLMTNAPSRGGVGFEVAAWAAQHPNVFVEGFAGFGAAPSTLATNLLARIEQAGSTKIGGFASGAATAEWVYGTLQATRKATSAVLAQAVEAGFCEEEEIPPLVESIFATGPAAWYGLAAADAGGDSPSQSST